MESGIIVFGVFMLAILFIVYDIFKPMFMKKSEKKTKSDLLCEYPFGSRVYGTNRPDSDYDYVRVCGEQETSDDTNISYYTPESFQSKLDNMDIQAMECYFLDDQRLDKIEDYKFTFKLDKVALRRSISATANNSWVKGKKRLIIEADYDKMIAIKSVFHSIRILDFGIQIASQGKITNYGSMNFLWEDILKISEDKEREELWEILNTKYKKLFNSKASEFKALCPHKSAKENVANVEKVLKKHGVEPNDKLVQALVSAIEK